MNINNVPRNLFLVENSWQVDDLLTRKIAPGGVWIATGPSAMHRLYKLGIRFTTPDDYCSRKEIEDACVSQFERVARVFDELDLMILERYPEIEELKIRPFFFHLRQFASLSDALLSRTLQLKKIIDNFKEAKIYVYSKPLDPWQKEFMFSKEDTLWGRLLALKSNNIDVGIITLPVQPAGCNKHPKGQFDLVGFIKKNCLLFFRNNITFYSAIKSYRKKLVLDIIGFFDFILKPAKLPGIIVFNDNAEWMQVLKRITDSGYRFYFLPDDPLRLNSESDKLDADLLNRLWSAFVKGFDTSYIDYTEILRERFTYVARTAPQASMRVIKKLEWSLANKKISAIFSSCGADLRSYVVKEFCGKKNIKRFCFQHGALWKESRINQRQDLFDLVGNDFIFVYGNRSKEAYETSQLANISRCEIVPVGMPTLDILRGIENNRGNKEFNILWPFGDYYGNHWYCGFSPPHNDRVYYNEQIVIVNKLLEFLDNRLLNSFTVKLYPGEQKELPPWLFDLPKSRKIKIISEQPNFTELLYSHNIVLIDVPTTTLLQAIATRLPVFVLTSVISTPTKDMQILKKRAVCCSTAKELMNKLEGFLRTRQLDADVNSREYLKLYGTHIDDGMSDIRAANFVKSALFANANL